MSSSGSLRIEASRITGNLAEHGAGLVVAEDSVATLVSTDITGNRARTGGGGVWVQPGATLELTEGSVVSANQAAAFGGGVWLQDAHLVGGMVSDNRTLPHDLPRIDPENDHVIIEEEAFGGSGVALSGTGSIEDTTIAWNLGGGGGLSVSRGTGTLTDVRVHDNDARPTTTGAPHGLSMGGGLGVAAGTVVGKGSTRFEQNHAENGGGGYLINGSIIGATFADNTASGLGGGLYMLAGELEGVVISGNTAAIGGGLSAFRTVRLEGATIENNHSSELGGGVYAKAYGESTLEIVESSVARNEAVEGGGIYVKAAHVSFTLKLTDARVVDNIAATTGGGLHVQDVVLVSGGEITGNTAASGGGAYVDTDGTLSVTGTDFGTQGSQNTPDDVATASSAHQGYGTSASFTCDDAGCTPEN